MKLKITGSTATAYHRDRVLLDLSREPFYQVSDKPSIQPVFLHTLIDYALCSCCRPTEQCSCSSRQMLLMKTIMWILSGRVWKLRQYFMKINASSLGFTTEWILHHILTHFPWHILYHLPRVSLLLVLACPIIVSVIIFVLYLHRACLVATIRSSGASQSTIKLVATNLIASGKLAGELLIVLFIVYCCEAMFVQAREWWWQSLCFRTEIEVTFVKIMCLIFPDSSFTRLKARLNGETNVWCLAARSENLNSNYGIMERCLIVWPVLYRNVGYPYLIIQPKEGRGHCDALQACLYYGLFRDWKYLLADRSVGAWGRG